MPSKEPILYLGLSRFPEGYETLPKGNAYLTMQTRAMTKGNSLQVYRVHINGKLFGIAAPSSIIKQAKAKDQDRQRKAKAIKKPKHAKAVATRPSTKKENEAQIEFRDALRSIFPYMAEQQIREVTQWAMKRGSKRIGLDENFDLDERAELAVRDYVFNCNRHRLQGFDVPWTNATLSEQNHVRLMMEEWMTGSEEEEEARYHMHDEAFEETLDEAWY